MYYLRALLGALLLGCGMGFAVIGSGFFIRPVSEGLGLARGSLSLQISMMALLALISLPIAGRLVPRFGIRRIAVFGGLWTAAGFVGLAMSNDLWMFVAFGVWIGIGLYPSTLLMGTLTITNWFVRRRGLMLGLSLGLAPLGGTIASSVLPFVIAASGWRAGYLVAAGVIAGFIVLGVLIVKPSPKDVGLHAYGAEHAEHAESGAIPEEEGEALRAYKKAIRSPQFWMIFTGLMLFLVVSSGSEHYPAFAVDEGFSPTGLATVMSVYFLLAMGGNVIVGWAIDRFGIPITLGALWAVSTIGWVLFLVTGGSPGMITTGLLLVVFSTCNMTLNGLLIGAAFGPRGEAALLGALAPAGTFGVAVGSPVWGFAHDLAGSYSPAFVGAPIVLAAAVILISLGVHQARRTRFVLESSDGPGPIGARTG